MQAFKTSVQRKIFIDKKIREKLYPTTVVLAKLYEKEFSKRVDPRTIAADISELRQTYGAPLKYDSKKKGYYYSDSSFRLNVLDVNENDTFVGNSNIKEVIIPDWQKSFLFPFMETVLPFAKENHSENVLRGRKITVLQSNGEGSENEYTENLFLKALVNGVALSIEVFTKEKIKKTYDFYPLYFVCQGKDRLFFGKEISETERFSLLNIESVITASYLYSSNSKNKNEREIAEKYSEIKNDFVYSMHSENSYSDEGFVSLYAQTTGNYDIEVVMQRKSCTHIFVFTSALSDKKQDGITTYSLAGEFILNSIE